MTLDNQTNVPGPNYAVALLDRIATEILDLRNTDAELKPEELKEHLGVALHELFVLKSKLKERTGELEANCREDERTFRTALNKRLYELNDLNEQFLKLDEQVQLVCGKLVHLGDQLERQNLPRKRIEDARSLILEFYKFLGAGGGTSANVAMHSHGDDDQLLEAASLIKSLSSLCLELPDDERFLSAKQRVTVSQQQLEVNLLERFRQHCSLSNQEMMKRISDVLLNSKSHAECAEIMIDEILKRTDRRTPDFQTMTTLLVEAEKHIISVFPRPESVLLQLINSLIVEVIKPYINDRIHETDDAGAYLANLHTEYQNMDKLIKALTDQLTLITDSSQVSKLFREVFAVYLRDYIQKEKQWLEGHAEKHMDQFYRTLGHQKRSLQASGLSDLKRDLKAILHIKPGDPLIYECSLLSEEVAVNLIEDLRRACKRCLLLSQPSEFVSNGKTMFSHLYKYLLVEHVEYGITLGLQALQSLDVKNPPSQIVFFTILRDATSIVQFFNKTVDESIMPLVSASIPDMEHLSKQRHDKQHDLETKIQMGLDKCLNFVTVHVQYILSSEQKKADFRPEELNGSDSSPDINPPSSACRHVCRFIRQVVTDSEGHLDGQNAMNFFADLGLRINRTLVDHFYGFTYSDLGAFIAMQDVTAYREVAKQFKNPAVDRLFDVLFNLMNLLSIKRANLQQVKQDYLQSGIPVELLNNFIQLRADQRVTRS